jgi:hypothetical protein
MTQASNLGKGGSNFNSTGQLSLTTGVTGTLPVANGGTGTTTSTGSGNNVLSTSPTLVTPDLGTPSAINLTNATSLPAAALPASGISASSITTGTLPKAQLPAGSVLQVIQSAKTDSFTSSSKSFVDITGLSVSITPRSASNKIMVFYDVQCGQSGGNTGVMIKLVRNSTDIVGDANGVMVRSTSAATDIGADLNGAAHTSCSYLDSPATTSSVTYKLQMYCQIFGNGVTSYINKGGQNTDYNGTYVSTITVMEIAV